MADEQWQHLEVKDPVEHRTARQLNDAWASIAARCSARPIDIVRAKCHHEALLAPAQPRRQPHARPCRIVQEPMFRGAGIQTRPPPPPERIAGRV